MTTRIYDYSEIFEDHEDGSSLMTIPEDICQLIGLNNGDTVVITVDDDKILIKKKDG